MCWCRAVAVSLLLVVVQISVRSQVIAFENAEAYSGKYARISDEYGDEVILDGLARVVTKIRFEYIGDFFSNLDERARLRIYANSGPNWMGNPEFPKPTEMPLWESPLFFLRPGLHTQEIRVPSIVVPERFTWTVQFYGLTMQTGVITRDPAITNDFAGLLFYGLATIGRTYNDFWQRLPNVGWTAMEVIGVVKNNFGSQVTVIPEAVAMNLTVRKNGARTELSWPRTINKYTLQSKTSLDAEWMNDPTFVVGTTNSYVATISDNSGPNRYFRLYYSAPPAPTLTITETNDATRVQWPAISGGFVLQSQTAANGVWQDVDTPVEPSAGKYSVLVRGIDPNRTFRLRETIYAARLELIREGSSIRIRWPRLATGYTLQSKPQLGSGQWVAVSAPVVTVGEYFEAQVPASAESEIFRLVQ